MIYNPYRYTSKFDKKRQDWTPKPLKATKTYPHIHDLLELCITKRLEEHENIIKTHPIDPDDLRATHACNILQHELLRKHKSRFERKNQEWATATRNGLQFFGVDIASHRSGARTSSE